MEIRFNRFFFPISTCISALAVLMFFVTVDFNKISLTVTLINPFSSPFFSDPLNILQAFFVAAPLLLIIFAVLLPKHIIFCATLPTASFLAAAVVKFTLTIENIGFAVATVAFFALVLSLAIFICVKKNKIGLCVLFCAACVICGVLFFTPEVQQILSLSSAHFLTYLAALLFCATLEDPEEEDPILLPFDNPNAATLCTSLEDVVVKVDSAPLSQTLDALLESYQKGDISKEEFEALKSNALYKL